MVVAGTRNRPVGNVSGGSSGGGGRGGWPGMAMDSVELGPGLQRAGGLGGGSWGRAGHGCGDVRVCFALVEATGQSAADEATRCNETDFSGAIPSRGLFWKGIIMAGGGKGRGHRR